MILDLVKNQLLTENGIKTEEILSFLSDLSNYGSEYSDLYFQSKYYENWLLEDEKIKEVKYDLDQGVGIRSINKETISFSCCNEISKKSLENQVNIVNSIFLDKEVKKKDFFFKKPIINSIYTKNNPLKNYKNEEKINILKNVNSIAKKISKNVVKVFVSLTGSYEYVLIASTDGVLTADIRPLVRFFIHTLVEKNSKREIGMSGGGGRYDYSFFLKKNNFGCSNLEYFISESVRIALVNLDAKEAPSGTFPVVLGSGWPGVLLHEAVGHGLEGDFNRRKTSVFTGKLGKIVSSPLCTVIDDGTIENRRGSLNIDDEGVASQRNVLIKNGILVGYLQDKFNARLMNTVSTGNGRRESYAFLPLPRMTNTYMLPGKSDPKDIINSVDYGLYATNFSGGQVDITSGNFVFSSSEAYLIKKGKIIHPVKNATLIGSGIDVMKSISMIGNDLNMDLGIGVCFKDGQGIPVGVGQPTVKIERLTVGGTKKT
ncbi:Metalloprotease TldD [Buchnera aphidicola (Tetraneura ulmi)]|uniref:metalloprotease TldD n=1 Tax=Buchnera aphidicola TaxID=9 RepID=UPI0034643AB4